MESENNDSDRERGQPSIADRYGEETLRTNVTLTASQRQWLLDRYFGIAAGIRHLIDQDMRRAGTSDKAP